MLRKTSIAIVLLIILGCAAASAPTDLQLSLGRWNLPALDRLIAQSHDITDPGARLVALSRPFLQTPYKAHTLIGGPATDEKLVIDLTGLDCFTFLDLIEALRRSESSADLPDRLRQVRYRRGRIAYENRRHFFSDWVADDDPVAIDVTSTVGQGRQRTVAKALNRKADGSPWLAGLPVVPRYIAYLPTGALDSEVLSRLRPGDFIGIYTEKDGLDVSHVGLLVTSSGGWFLRHASSRAGVMQVVDDEFTAYLRGKPGIVVYRVK